MKWLKFQTIVQRCPVFSQRLKIQHESSKMSCSFLLHLQLDHSADSFVSLSKEATTGDIHRWIGMKYAVVLLRVRDSMNHISHPWSIDGYRNIHMTTMVLETLTVVLGASLILFIFYIKNYELTTLLLLSMVAVFPTRARSSQVSQCRSLMVK